MIVTLSKKVLPSLLSLLLAVTTTPGAGAQDQQPPPANSSDYTGQGAPLSAQELNSLVAPIALYPDALVAQILSASTYPDQVAVAEYWIEQNKNLTGSALMQAVNTQSWDPSVKALTQFSSVRATWSRTSRVLRSSRPDVVNPRCMIRARGLRSPSVSFPTCPSSR